ncbi:5,10-methylene tetrahydromethanopterin reductase, partial [Burkholderia pseudomallei]
LTGGPLGWNVVTSYIDSAARNLGLPRQANHDERYAIADESLEVCYKLWEGSWEDGAVVRDAPRRGCAAPSKVPPLGPR